MQRLGHDCKLSQLATVVAGAAAAADLAPTGVVTSVKAQQSDDNGVADGWSDIVGSGQVIADDADNKTVFIDVLWPSKRYVRPFVARATQNATVGGITAIQYGARRKPVTHDANVTGEFFNRAAEGTA